VTRRRLLAALLILLLILGSALLWVYRDYRQWLQSRLPIEEERVLVVEAGMGADDIVRLLVQQGLVESPNYLRFYLWRSGQAKGLRSGRYQLQPGLDVIALVSLLSEGGAQAPAQLDLVPGSNLYELDAQCARLGIANPGELLAAARDPALLAKLGIPAQSLEGYLLPGRYALPETPSVNTLLAQMHERFLAFWSKQSKDHDAHLRWARQTLSMADHELITMASLVQREAMVDDERAVIARVFYNRLVVGMRLQSDPSCVYPPLTTNEKPGPRRCKDPANVYSTYVIDGLPPGPISCASEASLRAVLEPYQGPDAEQLLFFVARNDGTWRHYFSRTYPEHQQAVQHFLKRQGPMPRQTRQPR
jgi:UPF0755 protein